MAIGPAVTAAIAAPSPNDFAQIIENSKKIVTIAPPPSEAWVVMGYVSAGLGVLVAAKCAVVAFKLL